MRPGCWTDVFSGSDNTKSPLRIKQVVYLYLLVRPVFHSFHVMLFQPKTFE